MPGIPPVPRSTLFEQIARIIDPSEKSHGELVLKLKADTFLQAHSSFITPLLNEFKSLV